MKCSGYYLLQWGYVCFLELHRCTGLCRSAAKSPGGGTEGLVCRTPDTTELYTLRSMVKVSGEIRDVMETTCGIRKVEWKRDGLYINGKKTKTQGTNLHAEIYMIGSPAG